MTALSLDVNHRAHLQYASRSCSCVILLNDRRVIVLQDFERRGWPFEMGCVLVDSGERARDRRRARGRERGLEREPADLHPDRLVHLRLGQLLPAAAEPHSDSLPRPRVGAAAQTLCRPDPHLQAHQRGARLVSSLLALLSCPPLALPLQACFMPISLSIASLRRRRVYLLVLRTTAAPSSACSSLRELCVYNRTSTCCSLASTRSDD